MSRPTRVTIDPAAFLHNLQVAKSLAKNSRVMAVVKANAYGHGIVPLLKPLEQADAVGVSCIEEAMELRKLGCQRPILLLEGFFKTEELSLISDMQFEMVLHQPYQLAALQQVSVEKPIKIWLKINTGMNRLGFPAHQLEDLLETINTVKAIAKPVNLMSHFSDADDIASGKNQAQLDLFQHIINDQVGFKSMANSAAILSNSAAHFDWVRPGLMLYGVSPFAEKTGAMFNLKPVMTLRSELIAVQPFKKGEAIGYGGTWVCAEDMPVGVVAIGYADGYPWHAKSGTPVLVDGVTVPLVGRVSMDMLTVDLRQCKDAKVGSPVVLWGEGLPVEKVALAANTIPYELLCRINTSRVRVH